MFKDYGTLLRQKFLRRCQRKNTMFKVYHLLVCLGILYLLYISLSFSTCYALSVLK